MKYIIDRFEGDFAVCETDNGMVNIEKNRLPENVKSGDVLIKTNKGFVFDNQTKSDRLKKIKDLQNKLFK